MKQRIFEELSPHYDDFQAAGMEGLELLSRSPLKGVYELRRLQREPILNAFEHHLPSRLGSFEKVPGSYSQNRLVYHSDKLNADLIWRRRGGVGLYAKQRLEERARQIVQHGLQIAMFDEPQRAFRAELPTQIAFLWDLPRLDENHEAEEPFPFGIKIAKPGYKLDEGNWAGSFRLVEVSETYPKTAELDPNELDWEIEDEDEAQES